ncbi:type I-B CRISPR-associated protein Cas5 [Caloramator sp. E03]|uniref:type I-B CRISPR-associated protein Cas5b n=1 Tax=Caloramator sp. E03 TaxID=2576307 RepID=UPI00110FFB61|nr:type I-B CRISPR-associated protein Cas5b [Caloramator sp. E03]QCX34104.1 type I-B CRISPR-associated protein Cas5 [Caloramator sp. E03]
MEFLVFDIKGRYAHFRKFYTNSSSLSYSMPPRTTLEGIIAAILGLERDSYYDVLSSDNLNLSVRKLASTRKILQSLNYIKATSPSKIIKPEEHTQVPFELLTGEDGIKYRIYVNHKDSQIMDKLYERLKNEKYFYIPYLGAAPFNCSISFLGKIEGEEIFSQDYIEILTPIRKSLIIDGGLDITSVNGILIKEKMPRDFKSGRIVKEVEDYIYEEGGNSLKVKLKSPYYKIGNENIVLI